MKTKEMKAEEMKSIYPLEDRGARVVRFPDGQLHVVLTEQYTGNVRVVMPVRSPDELFVLAATLDALCSGSVAGVDVVVPYLMGARSDRHMQYSVDGFPLDSRDLFVVLDTLAGPAMRHGTPMTFNLFDVHNPDAVDQWGRDLPRDTNIHIANHTNEKLVRRLQETPFQGAPLVCVIPDKGARAKAVNYQGWAPQITRFVECDKTRDTTNGRITLEVTDPKACDGAHVVIIDDLCDGGGTFLAIAAQLPETVVSKTLVVSHGIFSKGLAPLLEVFDRIITTDSYATPEPNPRVLCIPLNL